MPVPRLASRISTFLAVLTCLIFALGVRDTPERPHPASAPTRVLLATGQTATLSVEVLAVTTAEQNQGIAKPLRGAKVRVFWNDQNAFRLVGTSRTNELGRAKVTRLPRGALWVVAESDGMARASTQLVLDEDERTTAFTLAPAQTLEVTVLDEQGTALGNATVLISSGDPLPYGALTEKSGIAKISRLGKGPYRIKASARGFESVQLAAVTANTVLRLRRLGGLLVRAIDSAQAPVANATITLSGTTLWPPRQVSTNAEGFANVRGLLAGSFDLRARKDTLVSSTELGVVLARGEERSITLRLAQGRMVTVWVTDGEGDAAAAVPNADVVVAESGLSAFPERGRTQANGKVTLGPFEFGLLSASAAARDFVGTSMVSVPAEQDGPLRIALRRGGTLRGQVVDVFDHPISGASIEVIGTDFSGFPIAETPRMRELQATGFARSLAGPQALLPIGELGVTKGPIPSIPGANNASGDYVLATDELRPRFEPIAAGSDVDNWVSHYDGSFAAHPVTPGRLRALVRHPAYVEGLSELVTLPAGGSADVKVVLHAGGALEGVVVDRYGRFVGGVRVELSASTGSRVFATYTAEDGAFAFAALPSEVFLTVARPESPERAVVREHFTIHEGKHAYVKVVLPEARESVECQVTDERGDPIEGAEIVLSSLDSNSPLRQTRFSGTDGRALFDDARDLELSLTVDSPGYAPTVERFSKAPERIHIVLRHGVKITGRVTSVRGRVNVANARVTIISLGRRRVATSDKEGAWQLADVPAGVVHVIVEAKAMPTVEFDRRVEPQARQDRAFDMGDCDLPEGGTLSGKVVDAKGNPVAGARVSTNALGGYQPVTGITQEQATSDERGQFRLSSVAIGKVTVYATAEGVGKGHSEAVEVLRDHERDGVVIRLSEALEDQSPLVSGSSVAIELAARGAVVVVAQVAAGSEAERAGMRAGDVMVAIDGVKVEEVAEARRRLSGPENQDVLIEIERGSSHLKIRTVREPVRR